MIGTAAAVTAADARDGHTVNDDRDTSALASIASHRIAGSRDDVNALHLRREATSLATS